ncbi:MAG: DUF2249 domain-containing protein [Proteobacteria bacterium]|nr:DUF2249 domain-containing protein [Pseudomonadota bacterium]
MPRLIDARELEPPQPFELTLAALDDLTPGDEVVLLLNRRPQPLYRVLERNGFAWREERTASGALEIHIYAASASAPGR